MRDSIGLVHRICRFFIAKILICEILSCTVERNSMGLWAGHVTRVNFHTYQFILDTVFLPLPRSQCSNIYTQSNMVVHSFLMANQFNSVNCSKHRCRTKTIDRSYVATPQQKRAGGRKPLLSMYTFIPGWLSCIRIHIPN